ncbi:zinc finger MYM-type protein 1-like [Ranitomeya imitator]|uniref:zinc finger MYM-type protein 1-like n=1 Tax=Ranitomeya imitator TaxID=111125 RepID=UPI0037E758BE
MNKTIDEEHLRKIEEQEKYWHQILERLIALVRVLGTQNLAFRGSNDALFASNNGNFLKFVEYLAMFDPIMCEHIRKIRDKEIHAHYLGKTIQNEMIQLLSNGIQEKILDDVKTAKYFSVVLNCTSDVSHVEQMTIIVRFVSTSEDKKFEIKEHFLGFIPVSDTTGGGLTAAVLNKFEEMSLSVDNLRGSHSLNLVVNDAAKCCFGATTFLLLVQNLYVFFSSSTQHWEVLVHHLPSLTLKPLSETRWESRIDALAPLHYQLSEVHDALMDIAENISLTGRSGNVSRLEAQGLAKQVETFSFVTSVLVWFNILYEINLTSKLLQSQEFDLAAASQHLDKTKKYLQSLRSDEEFEKLLVDAREIAEELGIPANFESSSAPKRLKKKNRQFSYEGKDELIRDEKQSFKINFYVAILDTAINSVDERFTQLKEMELKFGFLYHIRSLEGKPSKFVLDKCKALEKSLTHNEVKDIDAIELCGALQAMSRHVPEDSSPKDVLELLLKSDLKESVPNLVVSLRILLTLPVSVASGERSFSKLKLIKTYLRANMMQERLDGLATISIESEVAKQINLGDLVSSF